MSGDVERGRVLHGRGDYADVAVPLGEEAVVLFQAPLADSLATVRLVRERLLLATAFALALALVLGLTAAGMLSHRLLRLETAAERIAGGDFDAPIVDHGNDEIGELARAFDKMRVQLAQLDNARKEFVANASHELRTPLFSIGGFLELLADEDLDDETRRGFIETMQGQVQRLAKLSTDLLDLSRVDAGQLSVVREPVDLGSVVRMLAGEIEHLASSSGHELVRRDRRGRVVPGRRRADPADRSRARDERDHAYPGGHEGDAPSPAQQRPRRARRSRTTVPGSRRASETPSSGASTASRAGMASGSGLGLSIARELARLMGGDVTLASEAKPTVFVVDLPGEPVPDGAGAFSRENGSARARARREELVADYDPGVSEDPAELTHVDAAGDVRMVDVGAKPLSRRHARARARVRMAPETTGTTRTRCPRATRSRRRGSRGSWPRSGLPTSFRSATRFR